MATQARTQTIQLTGSAGSASGSADFSSVTPAELLAVRIRPGSQPATVDVTLKASGDTIFTASNVAAATTYRPRGQASDSTGAAIASSYVPFTVDGAIHVDVAQGNAGTLDVTLIVRT
jgi:hypothetical protein